MSKLDKFKRKDKNSDNVWSSISDLMSGLMIVFLFTSVIFMSKVIDENTNIKIINISKRLYLNVMQWKADDFGSIIQNQDFFQRGIIHEIVDTTKFKWKVGEKEDEH